MPLRGSACCGCRCATSPTTATDRCRRRRPGRASGCPSAASCSPASTRRTSSRRRSSTPGSTRSPRTATPCCGSPVPHARARANLRAAAIARGVAAERLVFAPHVAQPAHLARLRCADLALDVLPYGSHTTGSDALWAGVPLLTCLGNTFAGRVGASLALAAGLSVVRRGVGRRLPRAAVANCSPAATSSRRRASTSSANGSRCRCSTPRPSPATSSACSSRGVTRGSAGSASAPRRASCRSRRFARTA